MAHHHRPRDAEPPQCLVQQVGLFVRRPQPAARRLIGLIWMLTFGGMQWRIAGLLADLPFTALHSAFARWTRLGLWRR